MGHHMKMFDTVLGRLKVILLIFESDRNIPANLRWWVTFGQHLLTSLLTKITRNISITNTFEGMEIFGMSSYDKYFFGIWKYETSAFKRTINHVSTTSSSVSTLWDICARKSSKSVPFRQIRGRTWLLASYTYFKFNFSLVIQNYHFLNFFNKWSWLNLQQ